MLIPTILVIATLMVGAGFGLTWRRLEDLKAEINDLRSRLDEREGARPSQSTNVTTLTRPAVVRAAAGASPRREDDEPALFPLAGPSDDPFDDGWVVRPAGRAAPAQGSAITPVRRASDVSAPFRSFPTVPLPPTGPTWHPHARAFFALGALFAVLAPALVLLLGAPSAAVGATALALALAGVVLSLRQDWPLLIWVVALGTAGWTLWSLVEGAAMQTPLLASGAFVLVAAAALIYARITHSAGAGVVLCATMAAAAYTLALQSESVGGLAALGAIIVLAALVGASLAALELIHVGACLAACAGLFLLGGREDAVIWFAPACAWIGALFLGVSAVRAPVLKSRGTVVAATGALAPIFAALVLHAAGRELAAPWEVALALAAIAAALAGLLVLAARSAGSLSALGWAAFPLGFGALAAAVLAILTALPLPFAAAALGVLAAGLALINAKWPLPLWRLDAALAALAGAAASAGAFGVFALSDRDLSALAVIICGAVIPALGAYVAARALAANAPFSAMGFEAAALAGGTAAISGLIRLAYAPTPSAPLDFAEAGLHAAAWLTLALLVWLYAAKGAWLVRQWGATLLSAAALCVLLGGPLSVLNPWWGSVRDPAIGWPLANLLALGFLLPALAAWTHWAVWRPRDGRAPIALAAAAILTAVWAVLEIRRTFQGPDLVGAWSVEEFGAYAGAGCAAVILWIVARAALNRQVIRSSSTI